jgi:AraC-like DNA-binding protein
LLAPVAARVFEVLGVSASLWDGREWLVIHQEESVVRFELQYGVDAERNPYNRRCFEEVGRRKRRVRGSFRGFSDWFVPIMVGPEVVAVLVVGPFLLSRPMSAEVLERWRELSGRQGSPVDPEFAAYLSATLTTLVLEGGAAPIFEKLLEGLARLMSGGGRADGIMNDVQAWLLELERTRWIEHVWKAVREMIDDRSARTWQSAYRARGLGLLGLPRIADQVLVGLTANAKPGLDPVDEALRRHEFQRSVVELARSSGAAIAGPVGDHGVVFLRAGEGTAERKKAQLVQLADRAVVLARRFGLALHCGAGVVTRSVPLSRSYEVALGAAESALVRGLKLEFGEAAPSGRPPALRRLRRDLGRLDEAEPAEIGSRFDRYSEAVILHCGHRLELARAHLEVGFERVTEGLLERGILDEKNYEAMSDRLVRAGAEARDLAELLATYRVAIADVADAVEHPLVARQDRSLLRALEYVREHYAEALPVARIARIAGFAPNYFSELFRKKEGVSFARFLNALRLERAKQLLSGTELEVTRIARLSGFNSPEYFARTFRRVVKKTPLEYRESVRSAPVKSSVKNGKKFRS